MLDGDSCVCVTLDAEPLDQADLIARSLAEPVGAVLAHPCYQRTPRHASRLTRWRSQSQRSIRRVRCTPGSYPDHVTDRGLAVDGGPFPISEEPVPWLDANEQVAWRKLAAMMMLLPSALDAQLQREADLTHFAYYVLAMLSEAPGRSLRMSLLAAKSSSSPSRLSHTVSRLEAKGFVQRRRADEDGRGQVAMLTDEGYAYVVKTAPGHVQEVRRIVFAGLGPEAVAELDRVCTRLLSTLDPDGSLISLPPDHRT